MEHPGHNEFRERVFESSPMPIVIMDAKTYKYIDCNWASIAIYGYPSKEVLFGKTPMDVSAPLQYDGTPSPEKAVFYINKALQEGSVIFEWKHQRPDGEFWDAEVHLLSFAVDNRQLLQFSLVDITKRKQAEEELRKEMAFSKSLVDTAQAIVLVLDAEGRILQFNPYMEEISGYKLAEVKGKDWFTTFLPEEDYSKIRTLFHKAVDTIQVGGNVNPILTKDGHERQIEWHDKTLKDAYGNVVGLLAVGQDVTEQKKAEGVLRKLDQAKSDFISIVAHELRTPLVAIFGYSELLEDDGNHLTKEQRENYLSIVQSNAEALNRLVDDLLDIGRIQIGRPLEILFQEADLDGIIEKATASANGQGLRHKIIVTHNKPLPEIIWIDGGRITQVLNNLLNNAIKYSPQGGTIEIQTLTDEEKVTVSIQDQGVGMAPQQVEHIFDRFYCVDVSNSRNTGLGLGMTIVKHIIDDHGGEISVKSRLGEGTAVAFTLPRRRRN